MPCASSSMDRARRQWVKPGHDDEIWTALFLRLPFLRALPLLGCLLRHLLAFGPRLGKSDRDRLLAALDRPAGAAALQGACLALLHRAFDVGGSLFGIFTRH